MIMTPCICCPNCGNELTEYDFVGISNTHALYHLACFSFPAEPERLIETGAFWHILKRNPFINEMELSLSASSIRI